MRERDLLNWIIACAERTGWKAYHVPAPMTAGRDGQWHGSKRAKGLPDLFLLHDDPPRLIIAEVKGDGGKLTDEQREFLRAAKRVAEHAVEWEGDGLCHDALKAGWPYRPLGVYAWTPADRDIIEDILKSKVLT